VDLLLLGAIAASVALATWLIIRAIKSLELYILPIYAELARKRERDAAIAEYLTSILVDKGYLTREDANALKKHLVPVKIDEINLNKIGEILDKDPKDVTLEEIQDLKRMAYSLLSRMNKKHIKFGLKLLSYANKLEHAKLLNFEKVEITYDKETCTVNMYVYRKGGVDKIEGPDIECVQRQSAILKALARGEPVPEREAEEALKFYRICKERTTAGCRALQDSLSSSEKRNLDTP